MMNFEMDKQYSQYQINLSQQQLIKLIECAKKGTLCNADNDLIKYLEYKLNHSPSIITSSSMPIEIDLDEIPF